jgi:hypothetical protein
MPQKRQTEPTLFLQECNFSFEEENHMEGMKALILHEVNLFREEIRAKSKARNAAQLQVVRPPDRCALSRKSSAHFAYRSFVFISPMTHAVFLFRAERRS